MKKAGLSEATHIGFYRVFSCEKEKLLNVIKVKLLKQCLAFRQLKGTGSEEILVTEATQSKALEPSDKKFLNCTTHKAKDNLNNLKMDFLKRVTISR